MNEDCATFRDSLSAFADGELDAAEAGRLRAHLRSCESCREAVAAYASLDAVVAEMGARRTEAEWERLAERIDAAVARQPLPNAGPLATARAEKRRLSDRFGPRHLSLALGSAGTLVAALLVLLLRPLSEDLAPVDTVAPLGNTRSEERTRPVPSEARPERSDAPARPEVSAPTAAESPAVPSLEIGPGVVAPLDGATAGTQKRVMLDEKAALPPAGRAEAGESRASAEAPLAEPPARERLRALGYIDGGSEPTPSAATRGVVPRGVVELLHSVDEAEALLADNSQGARRAEILGTLVRLWADLVAIDPDHHCAAASRAAGKWEALALAPPGPAELDAVRRIREACPE
jgi:anti-sigma factor RsiW